MAATKRREGIESVVSVSGVDMDGYECKRHFEEMGGGERRDVVWFGLVWSGHEWRMAA